MKKLKIGVCYSFDTLIQNVFKNKDIFTLIGTNNFKTNMDFTDDIGDNISPYNKYVNEITVIYWMFKHLNILDYPEYIGLDHYRRYLNFNLTDLNEKSILCNIDYYKETIYGQYCANHCKDDLDNFIHAFKTVFPEYSTYLDQYLSQCYSAVCNIFIMHIDEFNKYCEFIIKCFQIFLKTFDLNEINQRSNYQKRVGGFILERFTGFYIFLQNKLRNINVVNRRLTIYNNKSIHG